MAALTLPDNLECRRWTNCKANYPFAPKWKTITPYCYEKQQI